MCIEEKNRDEYDLSVVLPAYNEQERIEETIHKITSFLTRKRYSFEVIVVDDGSIDNTHEILAGFKAKNNTIQIISNEKNEGKGFSVKKGVLAANGRYILFSDADLSTPIEEIDKLVPWLKQGYDIVIGSRGLKDSNIVVHQPFYREHMGRIFNKIARALMIKGISDTQCGFKCFKKNSARSIFTKQTIAGYSFDVEVLYIAEKMGYTIKEVPVRWYNSPASHVRIFSDSLQMLIDLIRIKLNRKHYRD